MLYSSPNNFFTKYQKLISKDSWETLYHHLDERNPAVRLLSAVQVKVEEVVEGAREAARLVLLESGKFTYCQIIKIR